MARTQTMAELTDELIAALDEEAARRGVSRSAVIRAALELYLEGAREQLVTNAIVEGYRRVPPATPDTWGELERQGERSTSELLQRLDLQDRRAGHGPW